MPSAGAVTAVSGAAARSRGGGMGWESARAELGESNRQQDLLHALYFTRAAQIVA
jgi:hypothetical protein